MTWQNPPFPSVDFVTLARIEVSQAADFRDSATLVERRDGGAYTIVVGGQTIACGPRDLTGKALEMVIAPSYDFSTRIDLLSGADIAIATDPTTGGFTFAIAQSRVATWPVGSWVHLMRERTLATNVLKDVMRGPFIVFPRSSF